MVRVIVLFVQIIKALGHLQCRGSIGAHWKADVPVVLRKNNPSGYSSSTPCFCPHHKTLDWWP